MTHATPIEDEATLIERVAAIWQRELNLGQALTADASFVALGGDSLILMAVIGEVEDAFGVELDVDEVVADLTVGGMARATLHARGGDAADAG